MNRNLYVVTVIFNPRKFKSRYKLYNEFKKRMEDAGAKLFTVEIAFGGRPFEITSPSSVMNLQLRTDTELWHKERGINLGFKQLLKVVPDAYYLGWFDADIAFSRQDWVEQTVLALDHYDIVQPFTESHFLTNDNISLWKCPGAVYEFNQRGFNQTPALSLGTGGHPGLAWAIRRPALEKMDFLMDFCAAGSGDSHCLNAWKGDVTLYFAPGMSPGFEDALRTWADKSYAVVQENLGYVTGAVQHYFHGKSEQRGYDHRWDILCYHQFDPAVDLTIDDNGLYRWSGNKPKLAADVRRSLSLRNEDSTGDC